VTAVTPPPFPRKPDVNARALALSGNREPRATGMHGLINRAVQCFVRDTYGVDHWLQVSRAAGFGGDGFDTMAMYDLSVTNVLVDAAAQMPGTGMRSIVMIVKRLSDAY
jgi:hypothetical protein